VVRHTRSCTARWAHVHHEGKGVFAGLPSPLKATRYHSLVVERASLPDTLEITAELEDGTIMGLRTGTCPSKGVQFHPESIRSEHGHAMLKTSSTPLKGRDPGMSDAMKPLIYAASEGPLSRAQAEEAFELSVRGQATPAQIGGC
jgi:hypothetical protein